MKLTIASYNLWFHRAYPEVNQLADSQKLDILCLQECFTDDLKPKAGNLVLAEAHTYAVNPTPVRPKYKRLSGGKVLAGNIGIALYYNPQRLRLDDVTNYQLPLPWVERKGGRTLQVARFSYKKSKQTIVVCNIHLSALWATNKARLRQMQAALMHIESYRNRNEPVVIAGDFNYPVGPGLRNLMAQAGYGECGVNDKNKTHLSRVIKGKFDRIFATDGLCEAHYTTLPFGASDHAPVLAKISNL